MADKIRKVTYGYVTVPTRAGSGVEALGALKKAGINMIAFSGFPAGTGKAQLDFIAEDIAKVRRAISANGGRLSTTKKGFHIEGSDRAGAVHGHLQKLAKGGISVIAANAVTTGKRYGLVVWVKPKDYTRAARLLKAK